MGERLSTAATTVHPPSEALAADSVRTATSTTLTFSCPMPLRVFAMRRATPGMPAARSRACAKERTAIGDDEK